MGSLLYALLLLIRLAGVEVWLFQPCFIGNLLVLSVNDVGSVFQGHGPQSSQKCLHFVIRPASDWSYCTTVAIKLIPYLPWCARTDFSSLGRGSLWSDQAHLLRSWPQPKWSKRGSCANYPKVRREICQLHYMESVAESVRSALELSGGPGS